MRTDGPSLTARGVALGRLGLDRPSTPTGDPESDERLATAIRGPVVPSFSRGPAEGDRHAADFLQHLYRRTRFFDQAVLDAIAEGIPQIVILGAGYDGRALRFRTPGIRFFEVDHPNTQADKRALLAQIDASHDDVVFVAADFTEPTLAEALEAAGHAADRPTLFVCEGVLRYLPEDAFRELLRVTAERAAPASRLVVSISTFVPDADGAAREAREAREQFLAESGEAVLTVPPREAALTWLAESGWSATEIDESGPRPGRLLVTAVPGDRPHT